MSIIYKKNEVPQNVARGNVVVTTTNVNLVIEDSNGNFRTIALSNGMVNGNLRRCGLESGVGDGTPRNPSTWTRPPTGQPIVILAIYSDITSWVADGAPGL